VKFSNDRIGAIAAVAETQDNFRNVPIAANYHQRRGFAASNCNRLSSI
jgi:hypothetical protein